MESGPLVVVKWFLMLIPSNQMQLSVSIWQRCKQIFSCGFRKASLKFTVVSLDLELQVVIHHEKKLKFTVRSPKNYYPTVEFELLIDIMPSTWQLDLERYHISKNFKPLLNLKCKLLVIMKKTLPFDDLKSIIQRFKIWLSFMAVLQSLHFSTFYFLSLRYSN